MKYAIYNAAGDVLRVIDVPEDMLAAQLQDGEFALQGDASPFDRVDVATGTLIPQEPPPPPGHDTPEYVTVRRQLYAPHYIQLEMLFDGMKATGEVPVWAASWYEHVKGVKDAVPKEGAIEPTVIYTVDPVPPAEGEV